MDVGTDAVVEGSGSVNDVVVDFVEGFVVGIGAGSVVAVAAVFEPAAPVVTPVIVAPVVAVFGSAAPVDAGFVVGFVGGGGGGIAVVGGPIVIDFVGGSVLPGPGAFATAAVTAFAVFRLAAVEP